MPVCSGLMDLEKLFQMQHHWAYHLIVERFFTCTYFEHNVSFILNFMIYFEKIVKIWYSMRFFLKNLETTLIKRCINHSNNKAQYFLEWDFIFGSVLVNQIKFFTNFNPLWVVHYNNSNDSTLVRITSVNILVFSKNTTMF